MRVLFLFFFMLGSLRFGPVAAGEEPVLYVYTWPEYFDDGAIREFERQHGCRVEFDYYESNEALVEALADGGGYDIITPSTNAAVELRRMRKLQTLEHALLPNRKHLAVADSAAAHDPDMAFSVPYTTNAAGIGYNVRLVPAEAVTDSWAMLGGVWADRNVAMLNDMREVLGAALRHNGHSANSVKADEIAAAADTVLAWKRNVAAFDVEGARKGLLSGKYAAIQAYSGDVADAAASDPAIRFFVPSEGSVLSVDHFVIHADSQNVALAHAFINYFLDPATAARNMEGIWQMMPNPEAQAMLPASMRANPAFFLEPETLENCEVVTNLGPRYRALYDEAWERVLFGD